MKSTHYNHHFAEILHRATEEIYLIFLGINLFETEKIYLSRVGELLIIMFRHWV